MRGLPMAKFAIAERHFLSLEFEDVKRLRRLGQEWHIDERAACW